MKLPCLFLLLFVTNCLCEKKLNLEDIEKDQYRSETTNRPTKKSSLESLRTEETKYFTKPEVSQSHHQQQSKQRPQPSSLPSAHQQQQQQQQQYYGPTTSAQELGNQVGDYAELQSYESFKYAAPGTADYEQNDDSSGYLSHSSALLQNQAANQQGQHYYGQQQGRSLSQDNYDTTQQQQSVYQPEVGLGSQQKALAPKYSDASNDKGTYFLNIPMAQLLAYYQQNYGISETRSKSIEVPQQPQPIPIPVYMPMLAQSQVYAPTKITYQPEQQYVPAYPKRTQQSMLMKPTKAAATAATTVATATSAPSDHHQVASQPQYSTQYELIGDPYQYYMSQQSQASYSTPTAQPQIHYGDNPSDAYADIYSAPAPVYAQDDNSLYDHQQQQQHQQPQYYVSAALAEQLMAQILQQANIQASYVQQPAVKQESSDPIKHYTSPQYQPQKFRSSPEDMVPVSAESEGFPASTKPLYSSVMSQPKTLLDSYVPSHVIAAQDANRYRERPIKLESGFLPSKINFIRRSYKKRKTD